MLLGDRNKWSMTICFISFSHEYIESKHSRSKLHWKRDFGISTVDFHVQSAISIGPLLLSPLPPTTKILKKKILLPGGRNWEIYGHYELTAWEPTAGTTAAKDKFTRNTFSKTLILFVLPEERKKIQYFEFTLAPFSLRFYTGPVHTSMLN